MNDYIAITVLAGITVGALCLQFAYEYIYDIRQVRATKKQLAKANIPPPHITIIMQTHNDETVIADSLASILHNSYMRYHIVIIDNASSDKTVKHLRSFARAYPNQIGQVIAKRKFQQLKAGELVRRYARGELVLIMASPHLLDQQALAQIVQSFSAHPQTEWLGLRTEQGEGGWILRTAKRYNGVIQHISHKLSNWPQPALLAQQSIFAVRSNYNRTGISCTGYAGSALAHSLRQPVSAERVLIPNRQSNLPIDEASIQKGARLFIRTTAAVIPLLFSSFIVLAIAMQDKTLFLYGWVIFSASIIVSITGDKDLTLSRKLSYLIHVIPAYILYCGYYLSSVLFWLYDLSKQRIRIL